MRKMLVNGKVREVCGWPCQRDPNRPCLRTPGHKSPTHRDAKQMRRELEREQLRRAEKQEEIRAYDKKRGHTEARLAAGRIHKLRTRTLPSAEGYCYVLMAPWVPYGLVKIGSTTDLKGNLKSARRYLPGAEHVRIYPGGALLELRYLHKIFENHRVDNEWFKVELYGIDRAVLALYSQLVVSSK